MGVAGFGLAREVLKCAMDELRKAVKPGDLFLYRSAADKAFLALVIAMSAYIAAVEASSPPATVRGGFCGRSAGRT